MNKAFRASLITTPLDAQTTTDPAAGGDMESAMVDIFTKCGVNLADRPGQLIAAGHAGQDFGL